MPTPDPNSDEYKYDYDHVEIDHDSDNKEIKGHDFNPVEEGSALHLEIHRAVDELGKYALELELISKDGISKDDMKKFIDEIMREPTIACLENGADIIGRELDFAALDAVHLAGETRAALEHEQVGGCGHRGGHGRNCEYLSECHDETTFRLELGVLYHSLRAFGKGNFPPSHPRSSFTFFITSNASAT